MADRELQPYDIPLNGRLVTADDGTQLEEGNFQVLENMRYGNVTPKSVVGMTKINTSVINATYLKPRGGHHFRKDQPSESHVVVQAWNTGLTASKAYENSTAIPSAGDFTATQIWDDTASAETARMSDGPDGTMLYCNGKDACVYGGSESRCAGFLVGDLVDTVKYDYTEEVNNTLTDTSNLAVLKTVDTSVDAYTMLLLHCNGTDASTTFTDSSPTTIHTVTANGNAQIDTGQSKFGGASGQFDGTGDYLTIPDNADFDLSDGTWAIDFWVRPNASGGTTQGIYFQGTETLDTEKVTNGAFAADTDWTKGANWAIAAGVATHTAGAVETLSQDTTEVAAETYKVVFTVTGCTAGSVTVSIGGTAGTARSTNATFTEYITAATTANLIFTPTTDFNGSLDDVSAKKVLSQNYMALTLAKSGTTFGVGLSVYTTEEVVALSTASTLMSAATWYHVEVVENGNSYYIFIDGDLKAQTSDEQRPANYTGLVYIGSTAKVATVVSENFYGHLDEFRVSNSSRHTTNFTPPTTAYGTATGTAYVYIASVRPIQGIKAYISTANDSTSSVAASYWANSIWNSVSSLTDNTASSGKTLAATGTITFTTTVSTAKPKFLNGIFAYWYLFTFSGIDNTTSLYYCTVNAPMQAIVDLWDGDPRAIMSYFVYTTTYSDQTIQVATEDYTSGDTLTYSNVGGLTSSQYLICGFAERMTGIDIGIVAGSPNSTACVVTVYYWNGSTWATVGAVSDGTRQGDVSLGKSGSITWDAPSESSEFKNSISNSELWHYYKIAWSATLSANTYIDIITGIPAQKSINAHSFPAMWQDRPILISETSGDSNAVLIGASGSVCVYNGSDSTQIQFGGKTKLTAGGPLYVRYADSIYESLIITKFDEVWLLDGTVPSNYQKYRISRNYGCPAPGTFKICDLGYEIVQGIRKNVLIWQANNAIVMCDAGTVFPISADIENYFDPSKTECIPSTMKDKSEGFYDEKLFEYHWLFASGSGQTTLNKEFVYDLLKKKWFEIDRGTGNYLQIGVATRDTDGNSYVYGGIDTGYIERLEYGTTFDGTNITSTFRVPDFAPGGWGLKTEIRNVKHIAISKDTTTNSVTLTHYGDCSDTASTATVTHAVKSTTHRIVQKAQNVGWGAHTLHSISASLTTSNENCGYEPVGLSIKYKEIREDLTGSTG